MPSLDKIQSFSQIAVNIAIVIGTIFAFVQYINLKQNRKIDRTISFIEQFNDNNLSAARVKISNTLRKYESEIDELNNTPMSQAAAAKVRQKISFSLAQDSNDGAGLETEIDEIIGFFGALEICLKAKICDQPTAKSFFGDYADRFVQNFGPYIEARASRVSGYGDYLMEFKCMYKWQARCSEFVK